MISNARTSTASPFACRWQRLTRRPYATPRRAHPNHFQVGQVQPDRVQRRRDCVASRSYETFFTQSKVPMLTGGCVDYATTKERSTHRGDQTAREHGRKKPGVRRGSVLVVESLGFEPSSFGFAGRCSTRMSLLVSTVGFCLTPEKRPGSWSRTTLACERLRDLRPVKAARVAV